MNRAIHIFPPTEVARAIEPLRQKYDPLHTFIGPHITLVFPFESHLSTHELEYHVKSVLHDVRPFKVTLQGITGTEEGFLFLNVKMGNDPIIRLHDRLYTGSLRPFLNRKIIYTPHLTVGKLNTEKAFEHALDETENRNDSFEFDVNEVVIEQIDQSGRSIILSRISI